MKRKLKRPEWLQARSDYYNPNLYQPFNYWETHDLVDGIKRDLSFKNVARAINDIENNDYSSAMNRLSCETAEELSAIYEWINEVRWKSPEENNRILESLSSEERKAYIESQKSFDIFKDFDVYYADFIRFYGIDLLDDNIDWFKFNWLLNGIMHYESATAERMKIRTWEDKSSKSSNIEYKSNMAKLKKTYSLTPIVKESTSEIINKLTKGG